MSIITNRIYTRLHERNKNFLGVVVGETGSGKSFSSLRLGELIDKNFSIDNIVFNTDDFMALLDRKDIKRGSCIVYDECGIDLDARSFFRLSNKLFSYVLQTFRHQNLAVLFTLPNIAMLDLSARRLTHGVFEVLKIDREHQQVVCKYFEYKINPRTGALYNMYPRVKGADGSVIRVDRIRIGMPSLDLINAYEKKKKQFTAELREGVAKELMRIRKKEDYGLFDPHVVANQVLKDKKKYIRRHGDRYIVDMGLIQATYGIGSKRSVQVESIVKNSLKGSKK